MPAVNGVVNLADVRGQLGFEFAHAGGRGGGDDDLGVWQAAFDCADEMGADVDLPDADGVKPDALTIGQRLFDPRVMLAESF